MPTAKPIDRLSRRVDDDVAPPVAFSGSDDEAASQLRLQRLQATA
jgi:hypothetical protein